MRDALNFHMKPHPVVVLRAAAVAGRLESPVLRQPARAIAIASSTAAAALPCWPDRVWHVGAPLDAEAMHAAAQSLLGRHDFTTFRAAACQAKSPVRTLDRLEVTRDGELIEIVAEARSFLHHQVRNIVGTLRLVGDGSWPRARRRGAGSRDRAARPTAPRRAACRGAYDDPF